MTERRIQDIIARSGWHISLIEACPVPAYAVTIGIAAEQGHELLWAGGTYYARDQIRVVMNTAGSLMLTGDEFVFRGDSFKVSSVHPSWAALLGRPSAGYQRRPDLPFFQVSPTTHRTLDVPDLRTPYDEATAGPWRWLTASWPFRTSPRATVSTDLRVLAGEPVVELERWDADRFAAHAAGYTESELREVPFGTLIALDASTARADALEPGQYVTRAGSGWGEPMDVLDKPVSFGA